MSTLAERIQKLPPELQKEVEQFIEKLFAKEHPKKKKLKMTWAGGLKEFRGKYTSLELQKKALEWWGD